MFGAIITVATTTSLIFVFLIVGIWRDPWHYWPAHPFFVAAGAAAMFKRVGSESRTGASASGAKAGAGGFEGLTRGL
jgi:hypothetical protein